MVANLFSDMHFKSAWKLVILREVLQRLNKIKTQLSIFLKSTRDNYLFVERRRPNRLQRKFYLIAAVELA